MHYIYVLKSRKNEKRYVGITSKLPIERLKEHNEGASKFTKNNRPYALIHIEEYEDENLARKREKFFKTGNGRNVLNRILSNTSACSSAG